MMNKTILTDADGVLLDWQKGFEEWMNTVKKYKKINSNSNTYCLTTHYDLEKPEIKKLIREFNESEAIKNLPAFRDAQRGVDLLTRLGYNFIVITSLSESKDAFARRFYNLHDLFPGIAFKLICLDTGADKDEALSQFKDSGMIWVEDKWENAVVGSELGLRSVIMTHEHNVDEDNSDIERVYNWEELCHLILNDEIQRTFK